LSAVKRVVDDGAKVRAVAVESGIDRMTLTRYIKKFQNGELQSHFGYWGNRRVFTEEEEIVLSEYLQTSSKMYFGLTPNEVQKLAFEYADKNDKHIPLNWRENNCAGLDWFQGFMHRHREISLRQPEATSIARASSFNPTNVGMFFDLLESVNHVINSKQRIYTTSTRRAAWNCVTGFNVRGNVQNGRTLYALVSIKTVALHLRNLCAKRNAWAFAVHLY
jgi:hypothetical protein